MHRTEPKHGEADICVNDYCKIFKSGSFYFAIAGYFDYEQSIAAKKACIGSKSIDEVTMKFETYMKWKLSDGIDRIRKSNKNLKFACKDDVAMVSFFRVTRNRTELRTLVFQIDNVVDQNTKTKIKVIPNEGDVVFLGTHDHIDKLPDSTIITYFSKDKETGSRLLIDYEMKYHPQDIGYPIDVLRLDSSGEHWIARKKTCH